MSDLKMPQATKPEDIILSDEEEQQYKKIVEAIGINNVLLIHKKHYKSFLVSIEAIKKDAVEEYKNSIDK